MAEERTSLRVPRGHPRMQAGEKASLRWVTSWHPWVHSSCELPRSESRRGQGAGGRGVRGSTQGQLRRSAEGVECFPLSPQGSSRTKLCVLLPSPPDVLSTEESGPWVAAAACLGICALGQGGPSQPRAGAALTWQPSRHPLPPPTFPSQQA